MPNVTITDKHLLGIIVFLLSLILTLGGWIYTKQLATSERQHTELINEMKVWATGINNNENKLIDHEARLGVAEKGITELKSDVNEIKKKGI